MVFDATRFLGGLRPVDKFDISPMIDRFRQGEADGVQRFRRNALMQAGERMAGGDLAGAEQTLFRSGDLEGGMGVQKYRNALMPKPREPSEYERRAAAAAQFGLKGDAAMRFALTGQIPSEKASAPEYRAMGDTLLQMNPDGGAPQVVWQGEKKPQAGLGLEKAMPILSQMATEHPDRYPQVVEMLRNSGYDVPDQMADPAFAGMFAKPEAPQTDLSASELAKQRSVEGAYYGLEKSLDDYAALVDRTGSTFAAGADADQVAQSRTNIQMQLKTLYELGALTGPDMALMEKMMVDPGVTANPLPSFSGDGSQRGPMSLLWENTFGTPINDRVRKGAENLKGMLLQTVNGRRQAMGLPPLRATGGAADGAVGSAGDPRAVPGAGSGGEDPYVARVRREAREAIARGAPPVEVEARMRQILGGAN